jgi:hypothetical protein
VSANIVDLEKALRSGVVAVDLGLPIALENASMDRPRNAPWAALHIMPAGSGAHTLGDGGEDLHVGIMQLDLNYPLMAGENASRAKVKAIVEFFRYGRVLIYGDTSVFVTKCAGPRYREVNGQHRHTLTISWEARLQR